MRPPSSMKSGPATKATLLLQGGGEQLEGVDVVVERQPEEVTAARDDEIRLRELPAERADDGVASRAAARALTNAMFASRAPERQSSKTMDSASMFGEM